jgi:hypothetical protein
MPAVLGGLVSAAVVVAAFPLSVRALHLVAEEGRAERTLELLNSGAGRRAVPRRSEAHRALGCAPPNSL